MSVARSACGADSHRTGNERRFSDPRGGADLTRCPAARSQSVQDSPSAGVGETGYARQYRLAQTGRLKVTPKLLFGEYTQHFQASRYGHVKNPNTVPMVIAAAIHRAFI